MPTKKKTVSKKETKATKKTAKKSTAKKTVKKAVKKKVTKKPAAKSTTKKKTVTKKPVAKKKAAPKKRATARKKKPVAKKKAVKKTVKATAVPTAKIEIEEMTVPVATIVEKTVDPVSHKPKELHRKILFIGTCKNCDHVPMGVNKLVAVLSVTIAILSGLLISQSLPMSFEMPSISMDTLTDWIIPSSNVNNL